MQLEIGKIYEGKVKNITQYGAFIDINGGGTGMVHISEISNSFVNEIREFLTENQEVKVKVIGINDAGKVSLSIKKAMDNPPPKNDHQHNYNHNRSNNQNQKRDDRQKQNVWEPKKTTPSSEMSFEDMMTKFKQNSEEKMCELKRSTDRKNRTRRK
ncbi:MAG: S1 RNA-binding domain-containing protein [Oscillospiraceae bacterium]|nr:S1 RNA-binding domain-containing protein [Oscillospiraceae bacterium]